MITYNKKTWFNPEKKKCHELIQHVLLPLVILPVTPILNQIQFFSCFIIRIILHLLNMDVDNRDDLHHTICQLPFRLKKLHRERNRKPNRKLRILL